MSDPVEEAEKLPLAERLDHSNWKVRQNAYEVLEKKFNEAEDGVAPVFKEFEPFMKKILNDKNVVSLEKGLDVVLAWADRYEHAPKKAAELAPIIVEKTLGSAKQKTKDKGTQLLLLIMEIDVPDPVVAALIEGAGNKVPKVAAASIAVITEGLKTFGVRAFPVKPVLKVFLPWFENTNKLIRDEAQNLTVELYRWLGEPVMKKQTEKLRPAQLKEIDTALEKAPKEPPAALKYLRKDAPQPGSVPTAAGGAPGAAPGDAGAQPQGVDPYDLLEPVNVLAKIGPAFYEGLAEKKWNLRKEQIDNLITLADTPKIENGDFTQVVAALKKLITSDSNVRVVESCAKALGLLGKGLRAAFAGQAKVLVPIFFEKFKEKKASTVQAFQESFENMIPHCFSLADIMEDIKTTSESKVPAQKKELLVFLTKLVKATNRAILTKQVKPLATIYMNLLEDSDPVVRDTAYESFGTMISFVGEKAVQGFLAKLDKIKEKKLREFIPATPPPQTVVAAAPPPMTTPIQLDLDDLNDDAAPAPKKGAPKAGAKGTPKKAAPKAAAAAEEPTAAPPKAAAKGTAVAPAATKKSGIPKPGTIASNTNVAAPAPVAKPAAEDNSTTPSMNQEEVVAKAGALISMDIINQLAEKKVWKQRLEAINALGDLVNKMDENAITDNTEVLMSLLYYRPGFSDTNFQIMIRVIQIVQRIASLSKAFARRHAAYGMEGIVEKLTDNKIKKTGVECLAVFCEVLGPQTVFGLIYKICVNHKTPKVISEALLFMASALIDFGLNTVELKPLVDCVKQVLENPNPVVKQSAVLLLAEMFKYMGPALREQLKEVKPALLVTIEQEFEKLSNLKPMTPAKKLRASAVVPAASATASASGSSNNNAAANDDLPRVDISGKLTPQLIAMIDDNDWKKRQEGLTQLEEILNEANKKIQPKLGNLMTSLKKRLVDTNKSITVAALNILGDLATAIGPAIEPNMKLIMSSILNNYTDNKIPVRVAVSSCLDKWVEVCGIDAFLVYLPNAMAAANGRKELLTWIAKHLPSSKKKGNDMKPLIKPILNCLQDKAAEVRQVSETLLGETVKRCGAKVIEQETSGLKPAFATSVKALLPKLAKETPTTPARSGSVSGAPKSGLKTPSAGSKSPTASGSTSPRPAAPAGPPILKTGKKDARAKAAGSWFFEEPTEEHVNMLKEQSAQSFSPDFHEKMFNFVTYADVITELDGFLVKHKDAVIDNLDIIFRWLTLRYFESDQTLLDKALELTKKIISTLLIGGYHLNDYEANCIVPIFVSRIGFILEESSRQTMRSVFGQFNKIYPASKLFTLLLQTLNTQNSEARLETLPQLYTMIRSQGMSVSSPEVVVPAIARVLSESTDDSVDDTNMRVREASLTLLAEIHTLVGDEIWKLVASNRIAQDYMATKIVRPQEPKKEAPKPEAKPVEAPKPAEKPAEEPRKAPEEKKAPVIKPQPAEKPVAKAEPAVKKEPVKQGPVLDPVLGVPQTTFQLEIDKIESSVKIDVNTVPQLPSLAPTALPSYLAEPTPFLPGKQQSRTAELKSDFKGSNLSQQASTWIREMSSNDSNRTIEALKSICIQLKEDEAALNFYADPIVGAISKQLSDSFSEPEPDVQQLTRLSKYLINTLMLMFAKKSMAHSVSQQVLGHLMRSLLQLLSDDSVGEMEEGKNILKALNLLIIKLLENTDKTACFSVLISQLKESIPPLETLPNSNPDGSSVYPKVTDMIVKCLLKITKVLSATINEVNCDALLREIHLFLSTHDPHKWKDKDHLPLSAVKTLLNEIVRLKGENISKHLGMIPTGIYPPPVILAYIKLMLKSNHPDALFELPNLASAALTDPEQTNGGLPPVMHTKESIMAGLRPVRVVPPPEIKLSNADFEQTNMILSAIFKKIEVSESSKQGIVDLYWALKDNPDLDIEPWLKRMNRLFRDYVERGLANLRNSSEGYENEDPNRDAAFNALAPSDVASAALDRLRQLRGRLGLGAGSTAPSAANGPSFATPVGLDAHAQPSALTITPTVIQPTITPSVSSTSTLSSTRAPSATVQSLRDRLRAVTTGAAPTVTPSAATVTPTPVVSAPVVTPAVTVPTSTSSMSAGTTTTVQGLRERLAKIKKTSEINN